MTQNARKLLGTVLVLVSIIVWCVLAVAIYSTWLAGAPWWALILFFAPAGLRPFTPR